MLRTTILGVLVLAAACAGETSDPPDPSSVAAPTRAPASSKAPAKVVAKRRAAVPREPLELGATPFTHAQPSLEDLGRAVVDALDTRDYTALVTMAVSSTEYKYRLFDALVMHPSAYEMGIDLLWDMHAAESFGDLDVVLQRYGGRDLVFESIRARDVQRRDGLVFHKRPIIRVRTPDDEVREISMLGTVIEHPPSGSFKILSYREDD